MKKLLAVILSAVMLLTLAACSAGGGGNGADTESEKENSGAKVDGDVVIIKAGDAEITFAEFNMYFRTLPLSLAANYRYYFGDEYKTQLLQREGLDIDAPLKDQDCPYIDGSYFDYFYGIAKTRMSEVAALYNYASEKGLELDDDDRAEVEDRVSKVVSNAEGALGSVSDYVGDPLGITTEEVVRSYYEKVSLYKKGVEAFMEEHPISKEDIAAEREANPGKYADDYYTKNVRHILFRSSEYDTDDECRAEAERILDEYLTDPTEEHFAALANEYTGDRDIEYDESGNAVGYKEENTSGGLYENVYRGQMTEEFENWLYDEARVPGDTGIVKSTYGYHVMYFVGDGELNDDGSAAIESALTQKAVDEYEESLGVEFDETFVKANIE